jgi:hypothetical protein
MKGDVSRSEVRMKIKSFAILTAGFLLLSAPVIAHHGGGVLYDLTKETTAKATITSFIWSNPHCEIRFDTTENGKVTHWTLEAHPPNIMVTHGWTRKVLKPGDPVTITFHPGRNGVATGRLIKVQLANGQELVQD